MNNEQLRKLQTWQYELEDNINTLSELLTRRALLRKPCDICVQAGPYNLALCGPLHDKIFELVCASIDEHIVRLQKEIRETPAPAEAFDPQPNEPVRQAVIPLS